MRMQTEEVAPGVIKATLTGRLDIGGTQDIDLAFNALAGSQRGLIVDMENVDFIASLGLRLLIVATRTMQQKGGRLILLRPTVGVESVLISSGTDNVVPILRNLNEAIHACSA